MNLFYDWYLPEFFNQKKVKEFKLQINKILSPLLSNVVKKNKFFVHRDFHLENLMMYKKKISLIDTQDAVIGHRAYDLASLIDDVRLNIKKSDQDAIFNYYIKKSPNLDKDFSEHFHILSIQRLLKILGIFVRLYRRDKKEKYLKYLNYTWKLIDRRLMHSSLKNLNIIFKKNFNRKIKNKKWK